MHRKSSHVSVVKQCEKFRQQNCRWNNESCWFLHETVVLNEIQDVIEEKADSPQVFQKTQMSPKPPYKLLI